MLQDFRYAIRRLLGRPGFTATTVAIMALGIGASTAIFSAVNPILLEPLPYPHADRLLKISYAGADGSRAMQSFGTYREIAARSRSFEAITVFKTWQPTITGAAEPERLDGQRVSASYFRALGVRPALGAVFDPADDRLNGPDLVMLSDALWRRRFGTDPSIVGRQIPLDGKLFIVAGVMPRGFENVLFELHSTRAPDALIAGAQRSVSSRMKAASSRGDIGIALTPPAAKRSCSSLLASAPWIAAARAKTT